MNAAPTRCQCPHWQKLFVPDYRHRGRQNYGSAPACQAASKRRTQARWLGQPENRDYFRGAENVKRVQQWRAEHPGYGQDRARQPCPAFQATCAEQGPVSQALVPQPAAQGSRPAFQERGAVKTPVLVGLIAPFSDAALPEDMVASTRRWIARGPDILDQPSRRLANGNSVYAAQENPAAGPVAAGAGAVPLA